MILFIKRLYRKFFWSDEKYARYVGVKIGDSCSIATRFFGSEPYLITIGNHVQITNDVRFATHGAGWVLRMKYPDFDCFGKIVVGDNVYIGNCALIMPGVTIGDNVIIGAGSVVTKSIANGMIVGGNPARVISNITDFEKKMIPFNTKTKGRDSIEKKRILSDMDEEKFLKK
ncbi:DapH/DapD/GlmU-related protein [Flavobacterium sp. WG21]|uniref:acyltransferase n=1 Tax=Flavobacterium sp. WG21 TaxID=1229487 RepID=UPI00035D3A69|nr:acyltransferase [Flavobacterium sp. WG21]